MASIVGLSMLRMTSNQWPLAARMSQQPFVFERRCTLAY
jgi:hypothetical protein